jgi:hypothetical protein
MSATGSLPDAIYKDGILAVNKKARRRLNQAFEGSAPPWFKITPGSVLTSPEYRALQIEAGASVWAMLCVLHDSGLSHRSGVKAASAFIPSRASLRRVCEWRPPLAQTA